MRSADVLGTELDYGHLINNADTLSPKQDLVYFLN